MGKIAGKISLIEARLQKLNQNDDYTEQLFIVTPLIIFFKHQSLQNKAIWNFKEYLLTHFWIIFTFYIKFFRWYKLGMKLCVTCITFQ